ncbi:MAG: hypothetical protein JSU98_04465 [Gemmatimonadales bacterium]|jgi:anti-sigma factor RsiW|nr:MAG: hypothetical protein JSU98_04465 [Gemmatimonadales bacterium]
MNDRCAMTQDRLPDLVTDRLPVGDRPAVQDHLEQCAECRASLAALRLLAAATPVAPAGLEHRIRDAARLALDPADPVGEASGPGASPAAQTGRGRLWARRWVAPAWGLAAAAALVLLLGRGLVSTPEADPDLLAMGGDEIPLFLADDGMVAGAPVLDGLTDEDLALLLEEMER